MAVAGLLSKLHMYLHDRVMFCCKITAVFGKSQILDQMKNLTMCNYFSVIEKIARYHNLDRSFEMKYEQIENHDFMNLRVEILQYGKKLFSVVEF